MLPPSARSPEPSITSLRHDPGDGESLALYWTFYRSVVNAQLARWLPRRPARVLDISGRRAPGGVPGTALESHPRPAAQAAAAGHTVIEVLDPRAVPTPGPAMPPTPGAAVSEAVIAAVPGAAVSGTPVLGAGAPGATGEPAGEPTGSASTASRRGSAAPAPGSAANGRRGRQGRIRPVFAEAGTLAFLADESVDAVVAEDRMLSRHLVTESAVAEIARVLRPGGRVLLCVDSLMLGMAILAEQNYWAHLSDVPRAEVVLVPWPDGTITRCFWSEQLREVLTDVGLEVDWIRPRTVLSPSTVEHVLTTEPRALTRLVRTELAAAAGDESLGIHLLASAHRPD